MQAGKFFQKWLGAQASGAKLVKGVTPATAVEVFSADSQPITNWIRHALKISDNTETEVIARHTELALRLPNHYSSVQRMGRRLFSSLGADYKKLIMKDASGLAQENRVTPLLLAQLMKAAADPTSDIGSLPSFMATSGDGGTLGGRFVAYNKTTKRYELVIPNGSIRAKTGYIGGLYSLAGIITTPENHTIVFAIFARQDAARKLYVGAGTKEAIDGIVEKLYLCGSKP
jgi:D-alanyl-D-alanine carboxypeptidase/D-alanyl-D-alanine-endopeptidase (penicillin-binding protein 4)